MSFRGRKSSGESPFQQTLLSEVPVCPDTRHLGPSNCSGYPRMCIYECLSLLRSGVKVVSKFWSANYTPCLLSVFAPDLASSCIVPSRGLTFSHLCAFLAVPGTLTPSVLCGISDVLESFPRCLHLTVSGCCGPPCQWPCTSYRTHRPVL